MLNSALMRVILQASETSTYAGDTIQFAPNIDISALFTFGDSSNQAEEIGVLEATVGTSAADFDLLTAKGPFSAAAGNAIPFNGVRGILIQNLHAVATLSYGFGTTNGWRGPFHSGVAAGTLVGTIPALQYAFHPAADLPWVISSTAKTLRMQASATLSAYVWLLGNVP